MDLVLNDKSLNGQYQGLSDFANVLHKKILPTLDLADDLSVSFLLKSYNAYNLPVTCSETVRSILKHKENPIFQRFAIKYAKYFLKGPYWGDSRKSIQSNDDCRVEAFYRDGIMLSFTPSQYNEGSFVSVQINGNEENICNAIDANSFLAALNVKGLYSLECNFHLDGSSCKFMIHTGQSEDIHNEPHFHIKSASGAESTTVSLKTFDLLVKEQFYDSQQAFFRKDIKIAKGEINKKRLIRLWNYFHPDRLVQG